ncbi:MAG: hypothetical protein FJ293_11650 [Planctomycetes bacterium]|nr:hypothetical protein [Planctomycetota bacterium]
MTSRLRAPNSPPRSFVSRSSSRRRWRSDVADTPPEQADSASRPPRPPPLPGSLCADHGGFSLHAKVLVLAGELERLEHLCRYVTRLPIATQRLVLSPDGRVVYGLKRHWRDGTSAVSFDPLTFIERLAALVPSPRAHQLTYHRVLAPASVWRDQSRAQAHHRPPPPAASCAPATTESCAQSARRASNAGCAPRRESWPSSNEGAEARPRGRQRPPPAEVIRLEFLSAFLSAEQACAESSFAVGMSPCGAHPPRVRGSRSCSCPTPGRAPSRACTTDCMGAASFGSGRGQRSGTCLHSPGSVAISSGRSANRSSSGHSGSRLPSCA